MSPSGIGSAPRSSCADVSVDVERDGYRKPEKITFAAFAERWLTEYLPGRNLKATTVKNYTISVHRHLVPFFGSYELSDLEQHPELFDRYVAAKLRSGLSAKSVGNTLTDLRLVLKQAVRQRLIRANPVDDVERPRCEPPEMQVLSEAEIARLWSAYGELEREGKRRGAALVAAGARDHLCWARHCDAPR